MIRWPNGRRCARCLQPVPGDYHRFFWEQLYHHLHDDEDDYDDGGDTYDARPKVVYVPWGNDNNRSPISRDHAEAIRKVIDQLWGQQQPSEARQQPSKFEIVGNAIETWKFEELESGMIPPDFKCPISGTIMEDPVVASDGFSYDAEHIRGWFDSRKQSGQQFTSPLSSTVLMPVAFRNISLKKVIHDWAEKNLSDAKYGKKKQAVKILSAEK